MRIQGLSTLLAATILFLSACSETAATTTTSTEPSANTSTTSSTVAETTTTTLLDTTTTTESVEVFLPNNDVEDPTEAIVAIYEYLAYLHTVPEQGPEYLDLIYLESCDCYSSVVSFLDTYASNGWVQDDQGIEVVEILVSQTFDSGDVLLQVTDSWSPQYVVDRDGNRIRLDEDEWLEEVSLVGLERGSDGRWRIAVIGVIGETSG